MIKKIITLFFFALFSAKAFSFVPSGDTKYFILEEKKYRLIFSEKLMGSIQKVNQTIKNHIASMSQFKNRELEKPITLILLSPKSQIPNAFATVLPNFIIGMYPSGMVGRNLHLPLWFDSVFEHELNHIFQLSHSDTPKVVRNIFSYPSLFLFYLVSPYPNMLLPMFVLEGDAVLKESILKNKGGRLYNGDKRALVYSQIKHYQHQIPKFIKEKLLHLQLTAHSGQEKYVHGGYFMAMLAETYPHDIVNSFFTLKNKPSKETIKKVKQASPKEKLSKSFAKDFSFKYYYYFLDDLVEAYFNHYLSSALKQKNSPELSLFNSFTCPSFNRAGNELFFLSSHLRTLPELKIFNTKTKKWKFQKIDLPLGKVFKIKDKYYSRSSQTIKPNTVHYSLFSEGIKSLKSFDSKYVEDITKTKTLYIDTQNTIDGFKLYLNDKFYSYIHSNALFDQKENIYYFKQKGQKRTLYKNKIPVFSYKGYYGDIMDIDPDGTIYFKASSPYGSSLFKYKNKKISRSSSSDTIIQAKKINNKEFLVCEVNPFGYEYKIIPIEHKAEEPSLYKYRFKSRSIKNVALNDKNQKQYKEYSSFRNIHYSGANALMFSTGLFSLLNGNFIFSDYLMNNNILLSYMGLATHPAFFSSALEDAPYFQMNNQIASASYYNKTNRLNWSLGYTLLLRHGMMKSSSVEPEPEPEPIDPIYETKYDHGGSLNFTYPLLKEGRWFSNISSTKYIDLISGYPVEASLRASFTLGYSQSFPFLYANRRAFISKLFLDYTNQINEEEEEKSENSSSSSSYAGGFKSGFIFNSTWHLGGDFYLFPDFSYVMSFNPDINPARASLYSEARGELLNRELTKPRHPSSYSSASTTHYSFDDSGLDSFTLYDMFGPLFRSTYKAHSIGKASLGLKKAFLLPINWINLHSFTPLFRVRYIIFENLFSYDGLYFISKYTNNVVSDKDAIYGDIIRKNIENATELEKEKEIEEDEYTQWLEWTFGSEIAFLLHQKIPLIIGFSFGFRTSIKFWKESSQSQLKEEEEDPDELGTVIKTGTLSNLEQKTSTRSKNKRDFLSPMFQFHLKMPL